MKYGWLVIPVTLEDEVDVDDPEELHERAMDQQFDFDNDYIWSMPSEHGQFLLVSTDKYPAMSDLKGAL